MVIKVYISGISGNKEVKKRQQRVLLILDSKNVRYEVIDIAEPGAEEAKDFMQNNSTSLGGTISDPSPRHPLPPQIFNDDAYCGDYDLFDMANEIDEMEKFLKIESADTAENISNAEIKLKNGEVTPDEKEATNEEEKVTEESEGKENEVPNEQEKLESEEKSKEEEEEEEVKENEDADTQESTKEIEEPTEDEEPKEKERKGSAESEVKEEGATGAGDEQEKEKEEGASSKTDEEKAEIE